MAVRPSTPLAVMKPIIKRIYISQPQMVLFPFLIYNLKEKKGWILKRFYEGTGLFK